jgi:hypothetical protein
VILAAEAGIPAATAHFGEVFGFLAMTAAVYPRGDRQQSSLKWKGFSGIEGVAVYRVLKRRTGMYRVNKSTQ